MMGWRKGFTLPGNGTNTLYERLEKCLGNKQLKSNGEVTPWHHIESGKRPRPQFLVRRDGDHALIVRLYDTNILWLLNDGTTLLTCASSWLEKIYTRCTFAQFGLHIRKERECYALQTQKGPVRYYDGMRVSKGTLYGDPVLQSPARPFTKAVANREVNKQLRSHLKPVYDVIDMVVLANTGQELWAMRNMHHDVRRSMRECIMEALRTDDWSGLTAFVDECAVELAEIAMHGVDNLWFMDDPKDMRAAIRKGLHEKFKTTKTVEYFLHNEPIVS